MKRVVLSLLLAGTTATAFAAQVSGVKLEDSVTVGGTPLVLNGAGVRSKYAMFKVYVIGLYVQAKTKDGSAIQNAKEPRRAVLVMKRDLEAATLSEAFHEGLENSLSAAEFNALKPQIAELDKLFKQVGNVKEGDRLTLDFSAEGSTTFGYKGRQLDEIRSPQLASALLGLWVGKKPVQDDLKTALLKG
ncbi:chalcone isomerase family protein [Luteimonas aquatica]|uniref:chalcone isomerase family protein n=1 Tax=Luteimonas aquatica TaxID=450364 RepID=UPI001F5871CD|nr:chalcone isomerase family protein [Luteimonas aquatica]